MDSWKIFDEELLPNKGALYSSLSIEDIRNVDYRDTNRVYKKINIKSLDEYHDLYVKHFCFQIYLRILETCVIIYMSLFFMCTWISMASMFK